MGETPTNETVQLNGIGIYQVRDDKIVTDWVVPDNINFLTQLGVIPPMAMTDREFPE